MVSLCSPGGHVHSNITVNINTSIFNFRSPLKQSKKRVNDGCFYGKLKTEVRGGERQYHEEFGRQLWSSLYHQCYNKEFEVSQHEMFLENLNMNSKALKNSVTQVN